MLASYNLRLSDGTLLVVDHDGLSTWLVDDKAMVQLVGSSHWRPLKAFLAEESAAARNASRQAEPKKADADAAWSREASRRLEEVLPHDAAASSATRREPESVPQPTPHAGSPWGDPLEPSIGARPNLLVLADDLAGPRSGNRLETPSADDGLPVIRLKARDERDEMPDLPGPAAEEAPPWQDPRDEKLFRTVAEVGGFLSVWVGRLDRQLDRLRSFWPAGLGRRRALRGDRARRWTAAVGGVLSRWLDRLGRQGRRLPSISPERLAANTSRAPEAPEVPPSVKALPRLQVLAEELDDPREAFTQRSAPDPLPKDPPSPPPPISELPILRLADIQEPTAAQDVYDGESPMRIAWLWTKRVVVIAILLVGGAFAALTWEDWLPKAERLSRILFAEIDRHVRSRDLTERRRRALQEAKEQLPYLGPGTIELVLSGGVLDPPDVFRVASDAADRGLSALPPEEALELKALRQQMLDTLPTEERQRVREYDRARGRRLTLPSEDSDVLELTTRSARALPPASRARLQVLSDKAIAAGLVQSPPVR
jgi:hypothetical protein